MNIHFISNQSYFNDVIFQLPNLNTRVQKLSFGNIYVYHKFIFNNNNILFFFISDHLFSFDCHDPGVFRSPNIPRLLEHYKVMYLLPIHSSCCVVSGGGVECEPPHFLVRATFCTLSRPSIFLFNMCCIFR